MGALFVYIIKSAVCLSAFYLFYRLLLSRETFHRFNRLAILGILTLSLLIPFCEVNVEKQTEVQQTVLTIEQLLLLADKFGETPAVQVQNENTVWIQLLLLVYLAGIVFFVARNIYSLIRLCLLIRSGERTKLEHNVTLIIHDNNNLAPFSWMKFVVISRKDIEENGREILIHELAHIRNRHSLDLLIADICIYFQWFNPAAWLLKQELQNIHEYEADERVIEEGVDAKQYQLLIIKKAVGTRLYSMANGFNHSKLKKRITMMLKEKSNPWAKLKYLYVLPLAAIAVTAFARPEISNELKEISKVKVNDLVTIAEANETESVSQIGDSILLIHGTPTEKHKDDGSLSHIEVVDNSEPAHTVAPAIIQLTGVNSYQASRAEGRFDSTKPESEADQIMNVALAENKVNVMAGRMSLNADNVKFSKPQGVVTPNGTLTNKEPLIIINGKESSYPILSALNPESIESIDVLKDKTSTKIYGEKGENGVIIVTLKSPEDIAKSMPTTGSLIGDAKTHIQGTPIAILDGKEIASLESIDPHTIKTIHVVKDISAANEDEVKLFEKYGERAKDGFVLVTSKKPNDNTGIQLLSHQRSKTISVNGLVTDESGKPIVGAAVLVSGTNVGTITNAEGKFQIMAADNATLTVSYVNKEKTTVKVAPNLVVKLKAE